MTFTVQRCSAPVIRPTNLWVWLFYDRNRKYVKCVNILFHKEQQNNFTKYVVSWNVTLWLPMSAQCKGRYHHIAFEGKLFKVIKYLNYVLKHPCSTALNKRHKQIHFYDIYYIIRKKLSSSISHKAKSLSAQMTAMYCLTILFTFTVPTHSKMTIRRGKRIKRIYRT